MSAPFPLLDLELWLRWSFAALLLIFVPGHLLLGHRAGLDGPTRLTLSFCAGCVLTVVIAALLSTLRIPVHPIPVLVIAIATAWLLGRSRAWRGGVSSLFAMLLPLERFDRIALGTAALVQFTIFLVAFRDYSAPPHVYDASNHAFVVQRVAERQSLSPGRIFEHDFGRPKLLYLGGWHAVAALLARIGGIAPYVSMWFLVAIALTGIPIALAMLFRSWRAPPAAAWVGAWLVASNQLMPSGALNWGGFGQIFGFLLVPLLALQLRGLCERPSWGIAVVAGLACGAQFLIHGSELPVAVLLAVVTLPALPRSRGRLALGAMLAVLVAAAVAAPLTGSLLGDYARLAVEHGERQGLGFVDALERFWAAGGKAAPMKLLTAVAVVWGFVDARRRRLAAVVVALALFYFGSAVWQDRLSQWLATPFYRQAPRILYLQIYVLPALMGWALWEAIQRVTRARAAQRGNLWAALATLAICAGAWAGQVRSLRDSRPTVAFSASSHRAATRLAESLPEDAVVANFWDDGSVWAMQIAGRAFLQPCCWKLFDARGSLRDRVNGLLERPWPEHTRALRERGVDYLWQSRLVTPDTNDTPPRWGSFAEDPRFELVVSEEDAVLYRIRWDAES